MNKSSPVPDNSNRSMLPKKMAADEVFTPRDLMAFLKIDENAFRWLMKRGEIPGRQIAGQWRFAKSAVCHWLGSRHVKSAQNPGQGVSSAPAPTLKEQIMPYLSQKTPQPRKPNPPQLSMQSRHSPRPVPKPQTIGQASFQDDGSYTPPKPFSRMKPWEKGDILAQLD